jgi:uncharacterized SAM-binding protein YcdF (DUF218 family)
MWPTSHPKRWFWGLLTREERWGLSGRGRLICLAGALLLAWLVAVTVHPFLAVTNRVDARYLVVEGWVHEYAIRAGVAEFRSGTYERVFATGGPVTGTGDYTSDYRTSAHVGAGLLDREGLGPDVVEMVPSRVSGRDRTYNSAVALRDWFREHHLPVSSINVVTENVHARRTRLLFQKAFGNDVRVGVIAATNPDYAPGCWWRCSEGVRDVLGEGIAYGYARLFFHPSN